MSPKPIKLTLHAARVVAERRIREEWIIETIERPLATEPDLYHKDAIRAFAPVAAFGNRVLRVVYCEEPAGRRIITVFFDRGWRKGVPRNETAHG